MVRHLVIGEPRFLLGHEHDDDDDDDDDVDGDDDDGRKLYDQESPG